MTALIRSELLQLRTLRSTYVMGGALLAIVLGMVIGTMSEAGTADFDSVAELREPMVAAAGIIGAVVLALLAATRVGGEYRYDTMGQRVLASPRRGRLLAAKMLTYAGVGAVVTAVTFGIGAGISAAMTDAEGLSLGLSAADAARLTGEVVLSGTLLSVLGASAGFLTRSQTAAVLVLFGDFFAEKLFAGPLGDVGHYLPFTLVDSLLDNSGAPLSPGTAAIALTAITAAVAGLAALALRRRDVV